VDLIVVAPSDRAADEGDAVRVQIPLHLVHVFAGGQRGEDTDWLGTALPPAAELTSAAVRPQDAEEKP